MENSHSIRNSRPAWSGSIFHLKSRSSPPPRCARGWRGGNPGNTWYPIPFASACAKSTPGPLLGRIDQRERHDITDVNVLSNVNMGERVGRHVAIELKDDLIHPDSPRQQTR